MWLAAAASASALLNAGAGDALGAFAALGLVRRFRLSLNGVRLRRRRGPATGVDTGDIFSTVVFFL